MPQKQRTSRLDASSGIGPRLFYVTGTDTGVGKTVVAALLTRYLRSVGEAVAAFKPLCSGGRDDARRLRCAAGDRLTLDEVNPWYFRAPLAPVLAARREGKKVRLRSVVQHLQTYSQGFATVIVEGAGGLLSPMGEDFDSRDLLNALGADPILVVPNRLGAVNQARMALEALPLRAALRARVVLINPNKSDAATRTNRSLLAEFVPIARIQVLPWLRDPAGVSLGASLIKVLNACLKTPRASRLLTRGDVKPANEFVLKK